MVGYFGVTIIHQTLTWIAGYLTGISDFFAPIHIQGTLVYRLTQRTLVESVQHLPHGEISGWMHIA